MDPSSKQQMGNFREELVFTPQSFDSFRLGFGVVKGDKSASVSLNGAYTYSEWNTPQWHERFKPAYYELQAYLKQYRDKKK